jgi:hypothetical protein
MSYTCLDSHDLGFVLQYIISSVSLVTYILQQSSDGRTMLGSSTFMYWSLLGESAGITVTG